MATNVPSPSEGGRSPVTGTTPPSYTSPVPRPTSGVGGGSSKPITSAPGTSAPGIGPSGVNKTLAPGAKGATTVEDISTDKALKSVPRVAYQGKEYPALAGIPLLRKLGQGGMGAVYYGIHPRLGNEVAVKILPVHLVETNPTLVDRFLREARIAAQIKSPHLPVVSDVNEEAGLYYLVMEFVNGLTGAKYLSNVKKNGAPGLLEAEACIIIAAACEGLHVAHAAQIVHRDIKPDNIMIPYRNKKTKELDFEMAKVMDLGLARHSHESGEESADALTATQMAMGTPGYMAPEQVMDARKAGVRSDVFSMGATLYALLAGQSPFHRSTSIQTLMATMECSYEPLGKARPDASAFIVGVVEKCLLKTPEERFANAGELLKQLRQGRAPETAETDGLTMVSARVSTSVPQVTPPAPTPAPVSGVPATGAPPRKKGLVLAGAALAATLVIGAVGVWIHNNSVEAEHVQVVLQQADEKLKNCLDEDAALGEAKALLDDQIKPKYQKESRVAARHEMVELYESLSAYRLDEAKKQADQIASQYPSEPGLADWLKSIKKKTDDWADLIQDVNDKVEAARTDLKAANGGNASSLVAAERKINTAKRLIPRYPALVAVERECASIKQKNEEKAAKEQKRQEFDALLAEVEPLMEKGQNLGEVETKLNSAKGMFPEDPRLKAALDTLKKRKEFVWALRLAGIALDADDVAEAEAKVAAATAFFPDDPRLKEIQDSVAKKKAAGAALEQQKRAGFEQQIAEANSLIGNNKLSEALEKIRAAERLYPDDPAIKTTRDKVRGKQSEAEQKEAARQQRLADIKDLDDALKAEDLLEVKKQLDAAVAKYPNDPELVSRRQSYDAKKKDADEKDRRKRFASVLATVDDLLKKKDADLFAVRTAIDQAKDLYPNDPGIETRAKQLKELQAEAAKRIAEEQNRKRFDSYLKDAADVLAKDGNLDEAQAKLDSAKELFPEDTKLEQLLTNIDTKRKDKIVKDISTALADGKLDNAGKQIAEAEANYPGDYLRKVKGELEQKKQQAAAKALAEKERNNAYGNLTKALAPAGALADARQLYEAFKKNYPNDKDLQALETALGKKVAEAEATAARKQARDTEYGELKKLLETLGPTGDLADAQKQLDAFKLKYQKDPDTATLDGLLKKAQAGAAAKLARDTAYSSVQKALGPAGSLEDAQSQLKAFKANYPNDSGIVVLEGLLKAKSDEVGAAKKQQEHDSALAKLQQALAGQTLDEAQKQFTAFKASYQDDPALPKLGEQLSSLVQADAKRRQSVAARERVQALIDRRDRDGARAALSEAKNVLDAGTVASLEGAIAKLATPPPPPPPPKRTEPPPPTKRDTHEPTREDQ